MKKLPALVVALVLASPAAQVAAQPMVEATAEVGFTKVNPQTWLGPGAYNTDKVVWGGQVTALLGRRGDRGLQAGVELGSSHLIRFSYAVGGGTRRGKVDTYSAVGIVRFWVKQGAWFGEAGAGVYHYETFTDPVLAGGLGNLFPLTDRLELVVKARGTVLFDPEGPVTPLSLRVGLSYQLEN